MFKPIEPGRGGNPPLGRDEAERRLEARLGELRLESLPAPRRADQLLRLAGVADTHTKEYSVMGIFTRLLGGRSWPLKIGAGLAALLLLLALSQLLPFAGGAKFAPKLEAASGGYVLVYALGPNEPSQAMHQQGQAIIEQWVKDNGIQPDQLSMNGGQDVVDGQYTVSLALIGASLEQAESLAAALAAIPGVPQPQIVEASWYQIEAAQAEKRGELLLYEFDHAFIFTRGTSAEQVEQTLHDYLVETRGKCDLNIDVRLEWTEKGHSCNVLVSPLEEEGEK